MSVRAASARGAHPRFYVRTAATIVALTALAVAPSVGAAKAKIAKVSQKAHPQLTKCEQVVRHVTALMKRMLPRLPKAAQAKMKAKLAAMPAPQKACAGKPALEPGVARCILGATRLRGLKRCEEKFGPRKSKVKKPGPKSKHPAPVGGAR